MFHVHARAIGESNEFEEHHLSLRPSVLSSSLYVAVARHWATGTDGRTGHVLCCTRGPIQLEEKLFLKILLKILTRTSQKVTIKNDAYLLSKFDFHLDFHEVFQENFFPIESGSCSNCPPVRPSCKGRKCARGRNPQGC